MSGGPLKDAAVIEASQGLLAIKVDLTSRGGPNQQIAGRFGIRAIPEIVYLDPDARELERGVDWDATALADRMRRIASEHRREPFFLPMEQARTKAAEGETPRPIAVLRADRSDLARSIEDLLLHADVREIAARFVWVRQIVEPQRGRAVEPEIELLAATADGTEALGSREISRRRGELEIPPARVREALERLLRRWESRRE